MNKENIIFIYPKLFTFIKTEIKILESEFNVISIKQNWSNKIILPFNFFIQFFFLIFNFHKSNIILVSFGGYWSFFPALFGRIFNKKVAIVVHGTDCVSFPEINYGNLRSSLISWFTKKSYQLSNLILPVSESLVYTENTYYSREKLKFGYTYHLKNIKTPYKVIPNGLITEDWESNCVEKQMNTFITVMTNDQIKRKGGDLIIEAAKELKHCTFYFAGTNNFKSEDIHPENVKFLGKLTPGELKKYYNKTQFYLQLSNFEGFGVAICEAMLCECVPIVSDVNFLPEIIGNSGFVLRKRDKKMLIGLLEEAMSSKIEELSKLSKQRIKQEFSLKKRKEMLISNLKNLK